MAKVSVLMPIYKTNETHLKEAIESIISQTYGDFEFLILNDSPDDLRIEEIVKSYNDNRIKYFKNQENIGITHSRNKLLEMAQGEYIAVMDHDGISQPKRFEKQVEYLENNPQIGVVGCHVDCFPKPSKLHFPPEDIDIKTLLMDICSIVHPSSMIRKSVLIENNLKYEAEYSPSEDYCLWCRLIEHTKFHNIQEVLFKYRDHNNNTSKHQRLKLVNATKQIHFFVRIKNPYLYQTYLANKVWRVDVRLFNLIPLFRIQENIDRKEIYLFNIIPILTIKKRDVSWFEQALY